MAKKFRRFMDNNTGSTTLLGEQTKFVGEFSGSGHFVVCGEVEGNCDIEGSLTVAVDGSWKGMIHAQNVIVAGEVNGEVQATGQLEVAASAKVTGTLSGSSIAIAEGAVIEGGVNVSNKSEEKAVTFIEKRTGERAAEE